LIFSTLYLPNKSEQKISYNTMILIYNTYKMNFKTNISKAKSLDASSGLEWINMSVQHYRDRIICIIVFVMKHLLSGAFFMSVSFCHLPFAIATKAQRHKAYFICDFASLRENYLPALLNLVNLTQSRKVYSFVS
jgi:hypothetical protein